MRGAVCERERVKKILLMIKKKCLINKDTGNLDRISNLGNTHGIARKHDSK